MSINVKENSPIVLPRSVFKQKCVVSDATWCTSYEQHVHNVHFYTAQVRNKAYKLLYTSWLHVVSYYIKQAVDRLS